MQRITALVTGGSRGIGLAIARRLAPNASTLLITSRKPETAAQATPILAAAGAHRVASMAVDHTSPTAAADAIKSWAAEHLSALDLLVLNAGYFVEGSLASVASQDFAENMQVNFAVNHHIVQGLLPLVQASSLRRIVLIGSTASYEAYPGVPTYGVAKWALRGYALNLRRELIHRNIGVTLLAPGGTLTDMWAGEPLPPGRLLEPDDIAKLVVAITTLSPQAVVEELICRPMLGDIHE